MSVEIQRQLRDIQERLERLEKPDTLLYVTGAWTPAFTGTGTAGTFTYTRQTGRYTRIGNTVILHGTLNISAISVAPTGNMTITGLPLTASNVTNLEYAVTLGYISDVNYSAGAIQLTGSARINSAIIDLYEAFDSAAGTNLPAAAILSTCFLQFSAVYQTG